MDKHVKTHLNRAVNLFGSQRKLGAAISCSQQYVSYLVNVAVKVPAEVAIAIETATGGLVSKSQLRPDLWPAMIEQGRGPGAEPSEQAA